MVETCVFYVCAVEVGKYFLFSGWGYWIFPPALNQGVGFVTFGWAN